MSENKKKGSWLSWLVIGIACVALIVFFMINCIMTGKTHAETAVQERLITTVSVWGNQVGTNILDAKEYGSFLDGYITEVGADIFGDDVITLMNQLSEKTSCYTVFACNADGSKSVDNLGVLHDLSSYSKYLNTEDNGGCHFYYLAEDGMGSRNRIVCVYPLSNGAGYILLFMDMNDVVADMTVSGYERDSFAVLYKKDGTIFTDIKGFYNSHSVFVTSGNILEAVQEGTTREKYNYFKSKLYGGSGCAIGTTYNGESRTIVSVYTGVEDWYFGFGLDQKWADVQIAAEFKEIRNTIIKLALVMIIFIAFVLSVTIISLTRNKEKSKKLEDKADTDLLTRLSNKAATERLIGEYMEENPDRRGVLFILDIDNFKKVNDTMGHAFGDTLLKTLGKEIRTEFRVTDIVGRTGGDEFMIFLKDIKDDLIVEREANRVTHFFHDFKAGGDYVKYSATASIGAAVFPDDGKTFKDLYVSADQALYRAKKRGKNQLVFFNEEKYGKQQ